MSVAVTHGSYKSCYVNDINIVNSFMFCGKRRCYSLVVHADVMVCNNWSLFGVADNFHKNASAGRRYIFAFHIFLVNKSGKARKTNLWIDLYFSFDVQWAYITSGTI